MKRIFIPLLVGTTLLSCGTGEDVLSGLSCSAGQIPRWDETRWVCSDDIDTDTDEDTLANLTCSDGKAPIWNEDQSRWECDQGRIFRYGVMPKDFVLDFDNPGWLVNDSVVRRKTSGSNEIYAPLHLPEGAIVSEAYCRVKDNAAAIDLILTFWRNNGDFTVFNCKVFGESTSGADSETQRLSLQSDCDEPVNNDVESEDTALYLLRLESSSVATLGNIEVYGCTVVYTLP